MTDITSFGDGPKSLVRMYNEQIREYEDAIAESNAAGIYPQDPQIAVDGEHVEINCSKRTAHDVVLGYMMAQHYRVPFSDAATKFIEELSAALIGRGAKP